LITLKKQAFQAALFEEENQKLKQQIASNQLEEGELRKARQRQGYVEGQLGLYREFIRDKLGVTHPDQIVKLGLGLK